MALEAQVRHWIRKVRGALGISGAWGAAGSLAGLVLGLGAVALGGLTPSHWIELTLGSGVCGAVLGCGFALTLMTLETRRSADELTPGRAAIWGGLAGSILTLVLIGATALPAVGMGILHPKLLVAAISAAGAYGLLGATAGALTLSVASCAPGTLGEGGEEGARRDAEPPLPMLTA